MEYTLLSILLLILDFTIPIILNLIILKENRVVHGIVTEVGVFLSLGIGTFASPVLTGSGGTFSSLYGLLISIGYVFVLWGIFIATDLKRKPWYKSREFLFYEFYSYIELFLLIPLTYYMVL